MALSDLVMSEEALRTNRYPMHLADGLLPPGFIKGSAAHEDDNVIAMDCEMVMTEFGLELARVSMVDNEGEVLLDLLVRPDNLIVDYLTKFSGITPDLLRDVTTSFKQAQKKVAEFIGPQSILVGHSLENDLNSLKIVHTRVIDTSEIYPHPRGPPAKLSLSMLAYKALKEKMNRDDGHDSCDDARMTLRLMQKKLLRGAKYNPCADVTNKVKMHDLIGNVVITNTETTAESLEEAKVVINLLEHFSTLRDASSSEDDKRAFAQVDESIRATAAEMTECELLVVMSGCGNTLKYFQLIDLKEKCTDANTVG